MKALFLFLGLLLVTLVNSQQFESLKINSYVGYVHHFESTLTELNYNSSSNLAAGFMNSLNMTEKISFKMDVAIFCKESGIKNFTGLYFEYKAKPKNGTGFIRIGKVASVVTRYRPYPISFDSQMEYFSQSVVPTYSKLTYFHSYLWESGWGTSWSISEGGIEIGEKREFALELKKDNFRVAGYYTNEEQGGMLISYQNSNFLTGMFHYRENFISSYFEIPIKENNLIYVDLVSDFKNKKFSKEDDFLELGFLRNYSYQIRESDVSGAFGIGIRNNETINFYFGVYLK